MATAARIMVCSINQAIAPSLQSIINFIILKKACMTAFNSVVSVGHLLWGMGEIHVRIPPHRLSNSSAVHASSIFPFFTPAPSGKMHLPLHPSIPNG